MKRLLKVIPMLLLMIVATGINAQQRVSVSGTVVDAKNLPLIGVAVVEKGENRRNPCPGARAHEHGDRHHQHRQSAQQ